MAAKSRTVELLVVIPEIIGAMLPAAGCCGNYLPANTGCAAAAELLSGVWFSLDGSPDWVQQFVQIFPLTHLLDAARLFRWVGDGR